MKLLSFLLFFNLCLFGLHAMAGNNKNETASKPLKVKNIDGDIIPADPGKDGYKTLLGIDSDNDGVRDDVELWINSLSEISNDQKRHLKEMSKILQNQLKAKTKQESIDATLQELSYAYCLESKLGKTLAKELTGDLKANTFNSKTRLFKWVDGQRHFGGRAVTLNTDESRYHEYCN